MNSRHPSVLGIGALALSLVLAACGSADSKSDGASKAIAGKTIAVNDVLAGKVPAKFDGTLRIATAAPYPPFEYFDDDQKLIGLDIDLGDAIAAKLDLKTNWKVVSFDGVIAGIKANKFDLILSDMGDNAEREKQIDFVTYALAGIGMVVPKGNPERYTTLKDFCGEAVSMEQGAIQVTFIQQFNKTTCPGDEPIKIKQFAKSADALLSLKTNKTAGFFVDLASGAYIAQSSDDGNSFEVLNDEQAPDGGYNPIKIGIGISKDNTVLRDTIKLALEELLEDGTYQAIFDKHGLQQSAIDEVEINGAEAPQ